MDVHRRIVALGALVCTGLWPGAPAAASQAPPPMDSVILGRVVDDETGQPIPGATVTLSGRLVRAPEGEPSRGNRPLRVLTNNEGYFVFRDLPPGPMQLTAAKAGYRNGGYRAGRTGRIPRPLLLGEHDTNASVEIRLWKYGGISGTVVDEIGDPVVGVSVMAIRREMMSGVPRLVVRGNAQTDDRGRYRLAPLDPGDYLVNVTTTVLSILTESADAYNAMSASERTESGARRPWGASIESGGSLVTSATAGLQVPPPRPGERLHVYQGTFHPAATSVVDAQVVSVSSGRELNGIDIQMLLTPAMQVRGRLVDPDGSPVAHTNLRLRRGDLGDSGLGGAWDPEATVTAADGRFVFAAVPPGSYSITTVDIQNVPAPPPPPLPPGSNADGWVELPVRPPQRVRWTEVPVSVGSTDISGLTVVLRPGLTVSGRLEFRGAQPPPGASDLRRATISLQPVGHVPPSMPRGVTADAEGRFETAGYPPGRYLMRAPSAGRAWHVEAIMARGRDVSLDPFLLDEDLDGVTIVFTDTPSRAQLSGSVQDEDDTRDTFVAAIPAAYQQWIADGMSPPRAFLQPVIDGAFHIGGMPPGDYLVVALSVDDEPNLQDSEFVGRLVSLATRITLAPREAKTQPLRAQIVRRER